MEQEQSLSPEGQAYATGLSCGLEDLRDSLYDVALMTDWVTGWRHQGVAVLVLDGYRDAAPDDGDASAVVSAQGDAWAQRLAVLRPAPGALVVYAPEAPVEERGTVLAVADSGRHGWAALIEWPESSERRSPEAFGPESFLVGLLAVR